MAERNIDRSRNKDWRQVAAEMRKDLNKSASPVQLAADSKAAVACKAAAARILAVALVVDKADRKEMARKKVRHIAKAADIVGIVAAANFVFLVCSYLHNLRHKNSTKLARR